VVLPGGLTARVPAFRPSGALAMARDLVHKAEQKLKGGFLACLAGSRRYEEASELYEQAATQFKISRDWQEAANCYSQCAHCSSVLGSNSDEARYFEEAGGMLKKISTAQAVEQYEKAIGIHSACGSFQRSGKLLMSIAELYEAENLQDKMVKEYYKRAAEMFELDDHGKSNLSKCMHKVALFAAKDGDLEEAIKIFENEGVKATQNSMLQYGAKEHFLNAGILHLVGGDSVTVNIALERYQGLDPRFESSREGLLLSALAEALEGQDADLFVDKLSEYDGVTKLDPWRTQFLVKVKDQFDSQTANTIDSVDLS
jgi:alpha-soluble NSF attachment protein